MSNIRLVAKKQSVNEPQPSVAAPEAEYEGTNVRSSPSPCISPRGARAAGAATREAASGYIAHGYAPIPIPAMQKNPGHKGWQELRLTDADVPKRFCGDKTNVGLLLGDASNGLIDIDLDAPEAVAAAPDYLPLTPMRHGRQGKPNSHWWYKVAIPAGKTKQYKAPGGTTLCELRSNGGQTVVPPSIHPAGDVLAWEEQGAPTAIDRATLEIAVARLAACSLVARHWPATGSRHDAALALSGLLLRAGWTVNDTAHFVETAARVAGDDEWQDRHREVQSTSEALATNRSSTGGTRLALLLSDGQQTVAKIREWLSLGSAGDEVPVAQAEAATPSLRAMSIEEILRADLPPREDLLSPILPRQGMVMVYAARGVGKTYFMLSLSYAVALGENFLRWRAPQPRRVLYIDGEMPGAVMKRRLETITAAYQRRPDPDYFRLITPDFQDRDIPDLAARHGQESIEPHLDGVDLVVLDNLATLVKSGVENEGESWLPVQSWLLSLRRRGIASVIVHHGGKNQQQRGTSRHEDVLDTVICLKHPKGYKLADGLRCEVQFEKGRGLYGVEVETFEAGMEVVGDKVVWTTKRRRSEAEEQVHELLRKGVPQRAIGKQLEISTTTVNRIAQTREGVKDAA